jgi:hypothetical protein
MKIRRRNLRRLSTAKPTEDLLFRLASKSAFKKLVISGSASRQSTKNPALSRIRFRKRRLPPCGVRYASRFTSGGMRISLNTSGRSSARSNSTRRDSKVLSITARGKPAKVGALAIISHHQLTQRNQAERYSRNPTKSGETLFPLILIFYPIESIQERLPMGCGLGPLKVNDAIAGNTLYLHSSLC